MHIANRYKIRNMGLNLTAKHVADYSLYIQYQKSKLLLLAKTLKGSVGIKDHNAIYWLPRIFSRRKILHW